MEKIVVPGEVRQLLLATGSESRQEVRDEWGNLVGYFEPAPMDARGWGPFTEADFREIAGRTPSGGRTLAEIMKEHGVQ